MIHDRETILQRIEEAEGPVDLSGLDLQGVDLTRLDLRGADLSRADLSGADLRWAVLEGADLSATVLRRADLRWAILRSANLRQADLGRANLGWSDVAGADLTDAVIDGAQLENVDLDQVLIERRVRGGGASWRASLTQALPTPSVPGLTLPRVTPALLTGLFVLGLALVMVWGWLYRRAYLVGEKGFAIADPGVAPFWSSSNISAGLLDVLGPTLLVVLISPLVVLALLLVIGIVLALPVLFFLLASRLLSEVVRPPWRTVVVGGLFVAFAIAFYLLIPTTVRAAGAFTDTLPSGPRFGAVLELFRLGGWITRLGLLLVLFGALLPLWILWRWISHRVTRLEVPARWRLHYPALNQGLVALRDSRLFRYDQALTVQERRRGVWSLAAILVLLASLMTGMGAVHAQEDMCDGGALPRVQLYAEPSDPRDEIDPSLNPREMCSRLLAETDADHFVFFPGETRLDPETGLREARVYDVSRSDVGLVDRSTSEHDCPTCEDGPSGSERPLVDPEEERVAGTILSFDADAGLVFLDPDGEDFVGLTPTILVSPGRTEVYLDGRRASAEAIEPGTYAVGFGRLSGEEVDAYLDARELRLLTESGPLPGAGDEPGAGQPVLPTQGPPATIQVDLSNPNTPIVSGQGFTPSTELQVGVAVVPEGADAAQVPWTPITTVTAGPDGSFVSPITFNPAWPTGSTYSLLVRDPVSGQAAVGDWLDQPPPTPTPEPSAVPTIIDESTPTPVATFTPQAPPTNTPFPTLAVDPGTGRPLPGAGPISPLCIDPDDFEYDDSLGWEKEIPISLGSEGAGQQHNFCSGFDIDLVTFPIKAGRNYRVETKDLAPGVDTVIALGNTPPDTPCVPFNSTFGCWSDDVDALSFASAIEFTAVADGRAIITVDNRGTGTGGDATYVIDVVQFVPEPTTTPTAAPTNTPEPTRTATATPLPFPDECDRPGVTNNRCQDACRIYLDQPFFGTIDPGSDVDYLEIDLEPGQYRFSLRPPPEQSYDLSVLLKESTRSCVDIGLRDTGFDDRERVIEIVVNEPGTYALRIDTYYPNVYGDPWNPYRALVTRSGPTPPPTVPTATATVTPTPSATPTITPQPSATPTLPSLLPTLTPTPTPTPEGP